METLIQDLIWGDPSAPPGSPPAEAAIAFQAEQLALGASAYHLTRQITETLEVPANRVWAWLCAMPDHLLYLLETPAGWSALSRMVRDSLSSKVDVVVTPAIH